MTVTVNALTDTVSPVVNSQLADLLGADDSDPLLGPMLQAATDAAETWLNSAIEPRQFTAYWPEWPTIGANTSGISYNTANHPCYVELPYTRLISVDAVSVDEEVFAAYTIKHTNPARLHAQPYTGPLEVTYTAGFANEVPGAIKQGILMAAAFLYDHRGTCDAMEALNRSGATGIMGRYKIELGF